MSIAANFVGMSWAESREQAAREFGARHREFEQRVAPIRAAMVDVVCCDTPAWRFYTGGRIEVQHSPWARALLDKYEDMIRDVFDAMFPESHS